MDEVLQVPRPRGRPPGSLNKPKQVIEPSSWILRSSRNQNIDEDVAFVAFIAATNSDEIDKNDNDPQTMIEALSGQDRIKWKEGI
ncbi:hypothetical protein HI914_05287 [Erysiphe necator]|nr:hypothetical protein HI914_05287 [Erysiphe necator]